MPRKKIVHTSRGWNQDRKLRSTQPWERGKGAPKKGNPRYKPKVITDKNGVRRKVYCLREKKKPKKK